MTMDVTGLVQAAGVAAAVLLGVWRMFAYYEQRHDAAHADLAGGSTASTHASTTLCQRMGNLYQWLVDRERA